eukprot:gnl/TRDRNA2_/TRDRNA2_179848_c0_seq1.p1 gnl/TRDRNA2_/TRDRNA2_179848_c0~~gnl/TRDRNA2_/TRDRNA2_179848_c0_seq1.p1  ORF type:complete len:321 (+),score=46.95 gnl/TRDRNA2_/TRDRNA2_179848_c0_seq1:84-965(+)
MAGLQITLIVCIASFAAFGSAVKVADARGVAANQLRAATDDDRGAQEASSRILLAPSRPKQSLRICNAYAWSKPLEVFRVSTKEKLTGDHPLAYKDCRDFQLDLAEGDQLDFTSGELEVGTFFATGVPHGQSSLLLIPRRRDASSMAIQFESHAFAKLQTAQLAVVDAYKGKQQSTLKIADSLKHSVAPQQSLAQTSDRPSEDLRYNSVVALNPGVYRLQLVGSGGSTISEAPIGVKNAANYVVMRVGGSSTVSDKNEYPEEVIVFPKSSSLRVGLSMLVLCIVTVLSCTSAL